MAPQLRESSIDLAVERAVETKVLADPEQLKQVLINLVQNAAEALGKAERSNCGRWRAGSRWAANARRRHHRSRGQRHRYPARVGGIPGAIILDFDDDDFAHLLPPSAIRLSNRAQLDRSALC